MTPTSGSHDQDHADRVLLRALEVVPAAEASAVEAQIAACPECRAEMARLRAVVESFVAWPTDVLRPRASLWDRVAQGLPAETGGTASGGTPIAWTEPEWTEVSPGISVKLLATDRERDRVSMLVRLAPGVAYPAHRHAGVEELHLLDGELIVDDQKLFPGDYRRAEADSADDRIWSETGCTCVLVTSPGDLLR